MPEPLTKTQEPVAKFGVNRVELSEFEQAMLKYDVLRLASEKKLSVVDTLRLARRIAEV